MSNGTYEIIKEESEHITIKCGCYSVKRISKLKLDNFVCEDFSHELFTPPEMKYYKSYRYRAERKKIDFEITPHQFKHLIHSNCFYCGKSPNYLKTYDEYFNGIDRLDNSKGYIPSNYISCCNYCNKIKSNFDMKEFIGHAKSIIENNKRVESIDNYYEEMLLFLKSGWIISPLKMVTLVEKKLINLKDLSFDYVDYLEKQNGSLFIENFTEVKMNKGKYVTKDIKINMKKDYIDYFKGNGKSDILSKKLFIMLNKKYKYIKKSEI